VRRATPGGSSAGGEQARALLGRARRRAAPRQLERALQLLVAVHAVLQAVVAAGGEQVAEYGELVVLRQLGRLGLDEEGALRRLLRAAVAPAEILRQRLAQPGLRRLIAARDAPGVGTARQA
jgi:hypothetical protein